MKIMFYKVIKFIQFPQDFYYETNTKKVILLEFHNRIRNICLY